MTHTRFRVFAFLAAFLMVAPLIATTADTEVFARDSATPAAQDSTPPPLAEAMPDTVQAYVASSFDPESDQFVQATSLTTRMLIPGAGDTIAAIVDRLRGLISVLPSDLTDVLHGEIGIGIQGFHPLELEGGLDTSSLLQSVLPGYAIVLHPAQAGDARTMVEDWYTDLLKEKGLKPERTEDGVTVVLSNPEPVEGSIGSTPNVVVFAGDYIFMGDSLDEITPFVEATQGNVSTLADSEDLQQLEAALPSERLLFGYVSGETLTESAASMFNDSSLAEAIDPPFGTTAFAITADDPGFRFESVSLPAEGTRLRDDDESVNPDFAAQIPESTLAMYSGSDLGDSWLMEQLEKVLLSQLMSSLGGGIIDLTDVDVGLQFGVLSMLTGINFKTDLIDELSGTYGAALFSVDTENPLASSAVIASGLDHPDLVSVGVTTLGPLLQSAADGSVSITTSSIADQTVHNVTLTSDDQTATIQYGVVDDQLMVGLGDGLTTLTQEQSSTLDDNAGYQAALAELPSSYSSVLYVDVASLARQLAPYLIEKFASGSDNPIARCILRNNVTDGTPVAAGDGMGTVSGALCSVVTSLLGDNWLQDFIVSRVPGPLTAVTYQEDGLQHISGIVLVGSDQ